MSIVIPPGLTTVAISQPWPWRRTSSSTPILRRAWIESEIRPSPHTFSRGRRSFSTRSTWCPRRAKHDAAVAPAGPAPTTTASHTRSGRDRAGRCSSCMASDASGTRCDSPKNLRSTADPPGCAAMLRWSGVPAAVTLHGQETTPLPCQARLQLVWTQYDNSDRDATDNQRGCSGQARGSSFFLGCLPKASPSSAAEMSLSRSIHSIVSSRYILDEGGWRRHNTPLLG